MSQDAGETPGAGHAARGSGERCRRQGEERNLDGINVIVLRRRLSTTYDRGTMINSQRKGDGRRCAPRKTRGRDMINMSACYFSVKEVAPRRRAKYLESRR